MNRFQHRVGTVQPCILSILCCLVQERTCPSDTWRTPTGFLSADTFLVGKCDRQKWEWPCSLLATPHIFRQGKTTTIQNLCKKVDRRQRTKLTRHIAINPMFTSVADCSATNFPSGHPDAPISCFNGVGLKVPIVFTRKNGVGGGVGLRVGMG